MALCSLARKQGYFFLMHNKMYTKLAIFKIGDILHTIGEIDTFPELVLSQKDFKRHSVIL